ncbi:MAG: hypothetical protein EZS28_000692 [Streblomastix strix]|uniref:NrS-1 polymerase-like helicase domain-containing protein n=1 Tax=Streblomastix strix TaxID=222440 RepID=A0A5J4X9I0_9EUKA|nr:MAG: hypothetical protein EZS28_000690 [Streblomastix strix]KAA6403784.1 MAG: hypothetical protein EZS28_000692 [Streblomastix strix]
MDKEVQKKEILHYKELNDLSNATYPVLLFDILGQWNVDLTAKDKDFSIINDDCTLDQMPKDMADACIETVKGVQIHNDTNTLEREISLLSLFIGLNGLQHLDYYISILKPLTIKSYESKKQLKIETAVKSIEKNEIDVIDSFTLTDVSNKALNGKCQNKFELIAQDLLKQQGLYLIRMSKSAIYDQLRSIRLWDDGKKHITGIDTLEQYHSLFEKLGFKHIQLDKVNQTKIEQFLALMKDIISANDERVYEYLLNQFTIIVQNVGKKTEIAIILKGLQGIGKNVFTKVLCELLVGYSSKNITGIDDFVGKFNIAIENKLLSIANEMMNFEELRMSNMDALKSIITEDSFVIYDKYVPKQDVQNIVNLIIVTNNIYPLKIENSDRRYVLCECNPVHLGDLQDISQFNPRDIPMTNAKKDTIIASISPVDDVIIGHFNSFRDGIICNIVD